MVFFFFFSSSYKGAYSADESVHIGFNVHPSTTECEEKSYPLSRATLLLLLLILIKIIIIIKISEIRNIQKLFEY